MAVVVTILYQIPNKKNNDTITQTIQSQQSEYPTQTITKTPEQIPAMTTLASPKTTSNTTIQKFITKEDLSKSIQWREIPKDNQILSKRGIGWDVENKGSKMIKFVDELEGAEWSAKAKYATEEDADKALEKNILNKDINGNSYAEDEQIRLKIEKYTNKGRGKSYQSQNIIEIDGKIQIVSNRAILINKPKGEPLTEVEYRVFLSKPFNIKQLYQEIQPQAIKNNFMINKNNTAIIDTDGQTIIQLEDFSNLELGEYVKLKFCEIEDYSNKNKLIIKCKMIVTQDVIYLYDVKEKKLKYVGTADEVSMSPTGEYIIFNSRKGDAGAPMELFIYNTNSGTTVNYTKAHNQPIWYQNFKWLTDKTVKAHFYEFDDNPYGNIIGAGYKIIDVTTVK